MCDQMHEAFKIFVLLPRYVVFLSNYVDSFHFMSLSFCNTLISMLTVAICISIPVTLLPPFIIPLAPGGISHVKTPGPFMGVPQSELEVSVPMKDHLIQLFKSHYAHLVIEHCGTPLLRGGQLGLLPRRNPTQGVCLGQTFCLHCSLQLTFCAQFRERLASIAWDPYYEFQGVLLSTGKPQRETTNWDDACGPQVPTSRVPKNCVKNGEEPKHLSLIHI